MSEEWNEFELRLAILQLLLGARKKKPQSGGASFQVLKDCLNPSPNAVQLQKAIHWLCTEGMVETGERTFRITVIGVDYVEERATGTSGRDLPPPGPGLPPWSPGDPPGPWPPKNDPDDPARVPLRRKPSGGADAVALPLPAPGDLQK